MALIKKADVPQYFAARRAMKLGTFRSGNQPSATGAKKTEAANTDANAETLKHDLTPHSVRSPKE